MHIQCSGAFFANSDITLYPIPKDEFIQHYESHVSSSASQESVAASGSSSQQDVDVASFQFPIGLLKSSNRKALSTSDLETLNIDQDIVDDQTEFRECLKTTWSQYRLEQEWIGFPKPDIEKLKAHDSEVVYYVVDGVHRWISWYIYNSVMKASGFESTTTINSKILPQNLSNRVLTLISSSINNAQETTVKMNVISLARYVCTMCKDGYTVDGLDEHITQLDGKSAASIGHFKQIGDRFEKLGLLDRLQDLADSLPNESFYLYPFKTSFILTAIMPNAMNEEDAGACLDYLERLALHRKKQVDEWKVKVDNATTDAERKGLEKPKKGKSIGDIKSALKAIPGRLAAVTQSVKLCEKRERQAIKLLKAKVGDEGVVPEDKISLVRQQTRGLKDEFLKSFQSGKFDNMIPEDLKESLNKKIPLSEDLVAEKPPEDLDGDMDSEPDAEESPLIKEILFEHGDSLTCFIENFKQFSKGNKAQLCLTDPPWGLLQAAKHQHDVEWTKQQWYKFAESITKSMRDDGVVLVFTPHFLLQKVTTAFQRLGWPAFRNPLYWVFKSKFFSYSHQPCNTVQPILAFHKAGFEKTFKVNIDTFSKLEQTWKKRNHNSILNVFQCKTTSTFRKKPRQKKSKGQLVSTEDEDDPEAVATQLFESGLLGDAKDLDEAKNRLDRFRVEEKPLFLLRLLIARYAPGDDDIVIDPCFGTGSTGVAAFLENKQFYGMDEDLLATVVADKYLKQTMNKAKAKSAGKAFGDPEAVEAGVQSTRHVSSSDDDEDEDSCPFDDSENEAVVTTPQDEEGTPDDSENDRWYLGDSTNDEGKHVLTLFYQKKDKSWDYENMPVVVANIDLKEGSGDFVLSLSLVSNLNDRFTLRSGNWDPQEEKDFSNANPLACMVSEKLKTLSSGCPIKIDGFTNELLQIIDEFDEVVHIAIDTFCIDDFQADAKVAAPTAKRRSKAPKTQQEEEQAKQAKQQRALKKLQLNQPGGKSPSKRGSQSGSQSPSKKHKKN